MKDKITVSTPSLFAVDESFDNERFMKVRINALSTNTVARGHGIRFSREVIEKAQDTFANIPILANVVVKKDKEGNETLDYGSHDFNIEPDKFNDGEARIVYEERIVGFVPSDNDFEIVDGEVEGTDDVFVTGFLFRDYGNYVCDIMEARGGKVSVSSELECGDYTYSADDKCNDAGTMCMCGVTLLGEDVAPAMPVAHAQMLSAEDRQIQMMSIMQELKESLDKYTMAVKAEENKNSGKEETQMENKHFEELLTKYEKKVEDIKFDYANMSDEELDAAFVEAFEKEPVPEDNADTEEKVVELSVKIGEGVKTFAKSLDEVIYALTDLVNQTYAEDGTYYYCQVFDGGTAKTKYVIMQDAYTGKAFKQSWNIKDGNYSLKSERTEVYAEWVTATERDQLDSMRTNYAALSEELDNVKEQLAKHQAEPEKMEILQADEYSQIAETDEYKELLDNHFDITKEDLSAKLDSILLAQVKANAKKVDLSAKQPAVSGVKLFPTGDDETGNGRYGNMFAEQK